MRYNTDLVNDKGLYRLYIAGPSGKRKNLSLFTGTTNKTKSKPKKSSEEDYYINYEYEIANTSLNREYRSDSLILPNPETFESKYTIDVLPNVELPDDTLADSDLRDHDFIDNIMYVYYGSHTRNVGTYGPEIIIIGSVLSCAAQLLTIFCVMLKKNQKGERIMTYIFFQIMGTFCISNLIFMLGVYVSIAFDVFNIANLHFTPF